MNYWRFFQTLDYIGFGLVGMLASLPLPVSLWFLLDGPGTPTWVWGASDPR